MALALLGVIAVWAIVPGVFQIVAAIRPRKEIRGEGLLVLSRLLSIAFGAILPISPAAGALAVVRLIGAYAVGGIWPIVLGFRLRGRLCRGAFGVVTLPGEATEAVGHGAKNAER